LLKLAPEKRTLRGFWCQRCTVRS